MGFLVENIVTCFGNRFLNLCLQVPVLLLWYLPRVHPDSCQTSLIHVNETPRWLLSTLQRAQQEGWSVGGCYLENVSTN